MSQLILVPTPVGNLEDITLRAIRLLKEANVIYAEDTRTTKKLLMHLGITTNVYAYHMHNEHKVVDNVINTIKSNELTVLVSDAGTPAISDPGYLLVRACIENDIKVSCLPGPTAVIPALVGSGFPCDRFVFEGFLPHKKGRQTKFMELAEEERTIVLYESPHRLTKCLESIIEFFGAERKVCVVREISKIYEEYKRGTAQEVLTHYNIHPPKGEIVVVIEGKPQVKEEKKNKYKE
jgi:16S rRNA (cytidine1402-2'-O)-methyltransferase